MREELFVEGRFPSLNAYVSAERANRFRAAAIKARETGRVRDAALAAGTRRFRRPVRVRFVWHEPDRRRDLDNVFFAKKFVLDGLVGAGVLEGDSQRYVVGLEDELVIDRDRPGVAVEIEEA